MALRSRLMIARTFVEAARSVIRPGSPGLPARFASIPRLVRASAGGEYTGTSRWRLVLIGGAALYLVSPIDLIPELVVPVLGLADDAVVLSWLAAALVTETERFLAWEDSVAAQAPVESTVVDAEPHA